MPLRVIAAIAVLAVVLLAGSADAARKKTFCQKWVKADKGKVVSNKNGVTVYTRSRSVSACTDRYRKALGLYGFDPGYRVSQVAAANKRCVAIKFSGKGKLDEILFKDVAGKEIGSSVTIVGYNYPSGLVGSLSVSDNCVAAWGEAVSDGSTTTYRVRLKAFGAASDVKPGIVHEIATVPAQDDIEHVSVKAAGRKVVVRWTQGGVAQTKTLP